MKLANDLPLPFPPDAQQIETLEQIAVDGGTIASEGTERFEIFSHMVDLGLLRRIHSPEAGDVYQFTITLKGEGLIQ